jgi:hypothetical protein
MQSPELSQEAQAFLRDHVQSYEELEVLLLCARHPETGWTVDEITERLNLPSASLEEALENLHARRILDRRDEEGRRVFRYSPASAAEGRTIESLAQAYEGDRLEIMRLMNANAVERVRNSAIRAFADAFLLRKNEKDG